MIDATDNIMTKLKHTENELWKKVAEKREKRGQTMNFNDL